MGSVGSSAERRRPLPGPGLLCQPRVEVNLRTPETLHSFFWTYFCVVPHNKCFKDVTMPLTSMPRGTRS